MVAALNEEFHDIVTQEIEVIEATEAERRDDDHVDLPRLALRFDNRSFGRLVQLIHRINELAGKEGGHGHARPGPRRRTRRGPLLPQLTGSRPAGA